MISGKAQVVIIKNDKALLNQSYCCEIFMGNQENIKEFDWFNDHYPLSKASPCGLQCSMAEILSEKSKRQILRLLSPTDILPLAQQFGQTVIIAMDRTIAWY